ncbi:Conserved protein containing a Zn-ribbon-like motif, possibly RNA-binding [Tistlia consotensis]|uniref:Conserved protein containing a Zn-ribbon-like motif, possibly RNA-binding n=1 Tax=Tistlia consotensis USBA 355 TaxID=560819 RepID=A0A1Y6CBZ6_9PROT|nr:ABATE domain-containing protein [Tistlia consotensis]SMF47649.1 Conserved protein containing a Zn-ribbon-like motif, possibly RNA-binding [Tistlia consotensis USBA 355]SNR82238.1 Conserved protein containing a Zn-ribbon-like motif, possibly RNA-binding [Tistlia consotensis]
MSMWRTHGFFGGHPVLDFANTLDDDGKTRAEETLRDWSDLLAWARQAEVVDEDEVGRLAACSGPEAAAALARLLALRELVWSVLCAQAAGRPAAPEQLEALATAIREALARAHLVQAGGGFAWQVAFADQGPDVVRLRLLLALEALLQDPELVRLRECGRCTALFLDRGRGVGRRWCRMETCGNRAKAERFRRK